jgi:hypothetical protein
LDTPPRLSQGRKRRFKPGVYALHLSRAGCVCPAMALGNLPASTTLILRRLPFSVCHCERFSVMKSRLQRSLIPTVDGGDPLAVQRPTVDQLLFCRPGLRDDQAQHAQDRYESLGFLTRWEFDALSGGHAEMSRGSTADKPADRLPVRRAARAIRLAPPMPAP